LSNCTKGTCCRFTDYSAPYAQQQQGCLANSFWAVPAIIEWYTNIKTTLR
jgi:hypothetical protein